MHVEDVAEGMARLQHGLDRLDGFEAGAVEFAVAVCRLANHDRAHHGGMIVGVGAGPFERQLVVCIELAAAGLVAAKQRVRAGADDEFVGGVVAAAGKDRALHGGQDVGLVGAGLGQP